MITRPYIMAEGCLFSFRFVVIMVVCMVLMSCRGKNNFIQRPRSYFKFELKPHHYICYETTELPFSFEVDKGALVRHDTSIFFDINKQNPYWINIFFPEHNATIYLSYIPVKGNSLYKRKVAEGVYRDSLARNSFAQLLKTSYELVYRHASKASDIRDSLFTNPQGIRGVVFDVSGNTATKYQFFATDTLTHYLRGVLYFETTPNEDSLRPLNQYYFADMLHLIKTLHWK